MEKHLLITRYDPGPAARAYTDVARRLSGEDLPVAIPGEKRGFMERLFGRRVA